MKNLFALLCTIALSITISACVDEDAASTDTESVVNANYTFGTWGDIAVAKSAAGCTTGKPLDCPLFKAAGEGMKFVDTLCTTRNAAGVCVGSADPAISPTTPLWVNCYKASGNCLCTVTHFGGDYTYFDRYCDGLNSTWINGMGSQCPPSAPCCDTGIGVCG